MATDQPAADSLADTNFRYEPDPDNPGWWLWEVNDRKLFNNFMGRLLVRKESDTVARVRMQPRPEHRNFSGAVHGGVIMSLADGSLFCASRMLGVERAGPAVTLDLNCHFISPGDANEPLDAVVEMLRETYRMVFLRGVIEQEGQVVAEFSGTIRKPSPPKSASSE